MESADLDVEDAARRLGPPTEQRRRGDLSRAGLPAKRGWCRWADTERDGYDVEALVNDVLTRLPPPSVIGEVARDLHADLGIMVVAWLYADLSPDGHDIGCTTPVYSFGPSVLAALTEMGASLEIDEYVQVDDRPDFERPTGERSDSWAWSGSDRSRDEEPMT